RFSSAEGTVSWFWVAGIIGPWHTAQTFWRTYGEKVLDRPRRDRTGRHRLRTGCPRSAAGVTEGDGRREPQNHPVRGRWSVIGDGADLGAGHRLAALRSAALPPRD